MFTGGLLKPHPDVPERVDAIAAELQRNGVAEVIDARPASVEDILLCHDSGYVSFLEQVSSLMAGPGEADTIHGPRAFPFRRWGRRPDDLLAQMSFYSSDTETPIDRYTWAAAMSSAGAALAGARILTTGASLVYAACRPPGHHAGRDWCGGFCYVNNAAVAASFLAQSGRVGILDLDYHHGNGTQDIFYETPDVLFVSIHADPNQAYPFFCGYSNETGRGKGEGLNHNFPLPLGATASEYLPALRETLAIIGEFAPDHIVVSFGTDVAADDPIGKFDLSLDDISAIGSHVAALGVPVLVTQEGGYNLETIGIATATFVSNLRR
jgi:acetoin utilization deacetylase AcuC-like enzyme